MSCTQRDTVTAVLAPLTLKRGKTSPSLAVFGPSWESIALSAAVPLNLNLSNPIRSVLWENGIMKKCCNISYIYSLSSSDSPEVVRYVGFSTNPKRRFKAHLIESKSLRTHKSYWIRSELEKGNTIVQTILRCVPEEVQGQSETETILLYKALGAKLTNHNLGGLGGISPSQETRDKIGRAMMGNQWNVGRRPSDENLRLLKEAARKPKSVEAKRNMSKARTGKPGYRRLSEEKLIRIYQLYNSGWSSRRVAEEVNVGRSTIDNILYSDKVYIDWKTKNNLTINRTPLLKWETEPLP